MFGVICRFIKRKQPREPFCRLGLVRLCPTASPWSATKACPGTLKFELWSRGLVHDIEQSSFDEVMLYADGHGCKGFNEWSFGAPSNF